MSIDRAGLTNMLCYSVLCCAMLCCQVVVLERTREAGKKVLMSGGTRCNVLPLEVDLPVSNAFEIGGVMVRVVWVLWVLVCVGVSAGPCGAGVVVWGCLCGDDDRA